MEENGGLFSSSGRVKRKRKQREPEEVGDEEEDEEDEEPEKKRPSLSTDEKAIVESGIIVLQVVCLKVLDHIVSPSSLPPDREGVPSGDMLPGLTWMRIVGAVSKENARVLKKLFGMDKDLVPELFVRLPSVSPLFEWTLRIDIQTCKMIGAPVSFEPNLAVTHALGKSKPKEGKGTSPFGKTQLTRNQVALLLENRFCTGGPEDKLNRKAPAVKRILDLFPMGAGAKKTVTKEVMHMFQLSAMSLYMLNTVLDRVFCPREFFFLRYVFSDKHLLGLTDEACVEMWECLKENPYLAVVPNKLFPRFIGIQTRNEIDSEWSVKRRVAFMKWMYSLRGGDAAAEDMWESFATINAKLRSAFHLGHSMLQLDPRSKEDADVIAFVGTHADKTGVSSESGWAWNRSDTGKWAPRRVSVIGDAAQFARERRVFDKLVSLCESCKEPSAEARASLAVAVTTNPLTILPVPRDCRTMASLSLAAFFTQMVGVWKRFLSDTSIQSVPAVHIYCARTSGMYDIMRGEALRVAKDFEIGCSALQAMVGRRVGRGGFSSAVALTVGWKVFPHAAITNMTAGAVSDERVARAVKYVFVVDAELCPPSAIDTITLDDRWDARSRLILMGDPLRVSPSSRSWFSAFALHPVASGIRRTVDTLASSHDNLMSMYGQTVFARTHPALRAAIQCLFEPSTPAEPPGPRPEGGAFFYDSSPESFPPPPGKGGPLRFCFRTSGRDMYDYALSVFSSLRGNPMGGTFSVWTCDYEDFGVWARAFHGVPRDDPVPSKSVVAAHIGDTVEVTHGNGNKEVGRVTSLMFCTCPVLSNIITRIENLVASKPKRTQIQSFRSTDARITESRDVVTIDATIQLANGKSVSKTLFRKTPKIVRYARNNTNKNYVSGLGGFMCERDNDSQYKWKNITLSAFPHGTADSASHLDRVIVVASKTPRNFFSSVYTASDVASSDCTVLIERPELWHHLTGDDRPYTYRSLFSFLIKSRDIASRAQPKDYIEDDLDVLFSVEDPLEKTPPRVEEKRTVVEDELDALFAEEPDEETRLSDELDELFGEENSVHDALDDLFN